MKDNNSTLTIKIGNTTFIVNAKSSDSAKKSVDTVFKELCKSEVERL